MSPDDITPGERNAVEAAADKVYSVSYKLYSQGLDDGQPLGPGYGREYEGLNADLREAVAALITAARADERAQLAARATDQELGMVMDARRTIEAAIDQVYGRNGSTFIRAAVVKALDSILAALTAARERGEKAERALAKRVAALEIAVVRACVPLEAFWADEGSRRYVAPSLRPLFEDAIAIGRAALDPEWKP